MKPGVSQDDSVMKCARGCLEYEGQEVVSNCNANHVEGDAQMIALQLWTPVHGAASLIIDGDYQKVVPAFAVEQLSAQDADRLLFSLQRKT